MVRLLPMFLVGAAACSSNSMFYSCPVVDTERVSPRRVVEAFGTSGEDVAAEFATFGVEALFTFDRPEDAGREPELDPFTVTLERSGRPRIDTHLDAIGDGSCLDGPRLVVPVSGWVESERGLRVPVDGTVAALGPGADQRLVSLFGRSDEWPDWAGDVSDVCESGATQPREPREAMFWLDSVHDGRRLVGFEGSLGAGVRNDAVSCAGAFATWTERAADAS